MGLVAPRHVGSSRPRAQPCVPCIGRRILNHCATREVLTYCIFNLRWVWHNPIISWGRSVYYTLALLEIYCLFPWVTSTHSFKVLDPGSLSPSPGTAIRILGDINIPSIVWRFKFLDLFSSKDILLHHTWATISMIIWPCHHQITVSPITATLSTPIHFLATFFGHLLENV